MRKQIVITELSDGFQWVVYYGEEVVGFGYEDDCFQAIKVARVVYDRT